MTEKQAVNFNTKNRDSKAVPTLDGRRTRVDQLNLGQGSDAEPTGGPLRRWLFRLNQVMAGMYTGLTCYGTPHSHRRDESDSDKDSEKPESRPL